MPAGIAPQRSECRIHHHAVRAVGFAKGVALETLEAAHDVTSSRVQHRFFVLGDGSVVETRAGPIHDRSRFRLTTQHVQRACLPEKSSSCCLPFGEAYGAEPPSFALRITSPRIA